MRAVLVVSALWLAAPPAATAQEGAWSVPVPGFGRAVLVPAPRPNAPLLAAFGGSWDRPEWLCEMLARAARGRAHLLCLRGRLRPERPADGPRWSPGSLAHSRDELRAALDAAQAALPPGGPRRLLLAGFSRGASTVAQLGLEAWPGLAGVLLVEGGLDGARRLLKGQPSARVAVGCGTSGCAQRAARVCAAAPARCLRGVDLRVGHSYNPPWEERGAELIQWLLDGLGPEAPRASR